MAGKLKLGDMMVRAGLVDQLQLNAALAHQRQWGGKLGNVLVELGFVDEDMLWKGLAAQMGLPRVDLPTLQVSEALVQRIPLALCEKYGFFPVGYRDDTRTLTVAVNDPGNTAMIDELQFKTRWKIGVALAPESEIQWAIRFYYHGDKSPPPPLRKKKQLAVDTPDEEELKLTDISGKTVMKKLSDIRPPEPPPAPPPAAPMGFGKPVSVAAAPGFGAPGSAAGDPNLAAMKAELDKNNKLIKALVELCINRGVFTQEEYVERMKR